MQATSEKTAAQGNYWEWKGHSIYYVKTGERQNGNPPLLLIHGFGASTDHWRKNLAGLQSDFEVWAIDLLGFGRSAKPNLAYSGALWQEQLQDFITQVIQQPAVLAGNSLGGYSALCLAANHPTSAAGLVLINSAGPFTETEHKKPNPLQKLIKSVFLQPWATNLLFQYVRNRKNIRKTLKKVYLDQRAVTDQLVEDIYRPSCDKGAAQVFGSVFKTPQGERVDVLLEKLTCPLLMLWGKADPWMNAKERGGKFRHFYPSLTEYYLEAGHCPHDEVPDKVNELIRNWVFSLS